MADTPTPPPQTTAIVSDALVGVAERWLAEQRRARWWGGFWKGLIAFYFGAFIAIYAAASWDSVWASRGPHAAVVKVDGLISSDAAASAENITRGLTAAFRNPHMQGLILDIDSPGGSPVQAERISDEIKRLKGLHPDTRVIAVIGDTGASAAYYIASAADTIYASRASLVGSIGVRLDSFGFEGVMRELGVERRLLTAGANKGILDPFSPLSETQRTFVQGVLDELHGQFIAAVKEGRGGRLEGGDELFSGLFWSGQQAIDLGLVDSLGGRKQALSDLGLEAEVDYTPSVFSQALGQAFGAALSGFMANLAWSWN